MNIFETIAKELAAKPAQVAAAVGLLDEGATVPFIARYRKEVTGGLDDTQLRSLEERLIYLRELEERRVVVLKSIDEQEKLTPDLEKKILAADTKTRLEDLYAPYKPKRRTKAQIAREAGLEPLLDSLLQDPTRDPQVLASEYINEDAGICDAAAALEGARQIFMERASEQADLVGQLRDHVWEHAEMLSTVVEGKEQEGAKFADYFDFREQLQKIPSHRALAMFRGRNEGVLRLKLFIAGQDDLESTLSSGICDSMVAKHMHLEHQGRVADDWLQECARWAWRIKISMQIDSELNLRLRELAEEEAIRVFGDNLRDLLLAAPAGPKVTLGLDPGLRTGVKVVVVDVTGKLLEHTTIYPHAPKKRWDESVATLAALSKKHGVELVSIGNGTASRETDKLVSDLKRKHPELKLTSLVVSEAGASVYSASASAAQEFPDLDVSLRGAVSIARRLQDPLAELVKIEPKAIGVGQYQHDVNQFKLARKLEAIVEDCVNAVGVDVNTASVPLLTRVAGLSDTLAANVVEHRDRNGAFRTRSELLNVARLGPKAFEQAAGFMRIMNGDNPLDASAVHPESYPLVERILEKNSLQITDVIGDSGFLKKLAANDYTDDRFGVETFADIVRELHKPGRDPRPDFKTAEFRDGIEEVSDLEPGLVLEGVVTNVTNFGAFVDVGVHQDGLVHISNLADRFVKDPRDVVKTGEVVRVKVLDVDIRRKRIGLTMQLAEKVEKPQSSEQRKPRKKGGKPVKAGRNQPITAMAEAFAKLKR